jgi:hypothetical protein
MLGTIAAQLSQLVGERIKCSAPDLRALLVAAELVKPGAKIMDTNLVPSSERLEQSLIDIAVESWRLSRLFSRVVNKLDAGEAGRYVSQFRYFQKKVEENLEANGLKLVNVEGQPFDPGIAAVALNIGDFEPDDQLLVDHMVEPIIMGAEGLRKQGTVMLRKMHA